MMKNEFEDRIGNPVSDEEYGTIEYVYTWHPAITETGGKTQIADLYTNYGMTVIEDMVERAGKMEKLDGDLKVAQRQVTFVQDRIKALSKVETPGAATPGESR
jgi:hypothetical protein